jgi:serine/threonine protein kinase/WD40 repeat protein
MTDSRRQRIEQIYLDALDIPAVDRPGFLDRSCQDDRALRNDVEALLALQPAADTFFEQPALESAAQTLAAVLPALRPPEIPGYQIIRHLGEGGMGLVYLARQEVPLRRLVALKVIRPDMDSRQVVARFDTERQALAQMDHPNIAAIHEAGTTPDGRPYFVMEFVDGLPISEYCDRRELPTAARLALFTQVCSAVQHAHQKGVIHRDLKPSNVLVTEQDGRPIPKVIDFGTAKAIARPGEGGAVTLTAHGMVLGTIEYMSPEQAAFSRDIDTTTDVYSLGVMLYELLVGVLPFDRPRPGPEGYDELRRLIRESDPPRLSTRLASIAGSRPGIASARQTDPDRLSRSLRGDLDWITLKALEKDRTRRYPTVAAFATDIQRFLADQPIDARPPSAAYRLRKFTRRNRGAVAAALSLFAVLVVGLAISRSQYLRAERERADADRLRAEADDQRAHAYAARRQAEATSIDAIAQRNAAIVANEAAETSRLTAVKEAASAQRALQEAEFRTYAANISAAEIELRSDFPLAAQQRLLTVPPALRGWEWRHLLHRADPSLRTLTAATPCPTYGSQEIARFIASNNVLSFGDAGRALMLRRCGSVEIWDPATYAAGPVRNVALSTLLAVNAARQLVVVEQRGAAPWHLHLHRAGDARAVMTLGPFAAEPRCADLSADGMRVAVGLMAAKAPNGEPLEDIFEIWNANTGQRIVRLSPPRPALWDTRNAYPTPCMVVFSPDRAVVATSGATVHVWHTESGSEVVGETVQAGLVSQPIAFSADGRRLAIGRSTGLVDVLDWQLQAASVPFDGNGLIAVSPIPEDQRRILIRNRRKNEVLSLAFSPDGRQIVSGTDTRVGIWDVATRKLTSILSGHEAEIIGVAIAPDGKRIFTADAGGQMRVWPSTPATPVVRLPGSSGHGSSIVLSGDGSAVGVSAQDGELSVWNLADRRNIIVRPGIGKLNVPGVARSIAISADGRRLLSGHADPIGTVQMWTVGLSTVVDTATAETFEPGCQNPDYAGAVNRAYPVDLMMPSHDGRLLAHKHGLCVIVRELPTMRRLAVVRLGETPTSLAFRPDGRLIVIQYRRAAGSSEPLTLPMVKIWDWRTHRVVVSAVPPRVGPGIWQIWKVVVSPDGRRLALVGGTPAVGSMVSIWDGDLTRELGRLPAGDIANVAFSPDGRRIASVNSIEQAVRIWDVERLVPLLTLLDTDGHNGGVAFGANGQLVAGRTAGGLTIWESVNPHIAK